MKIKLLLGTVIIASQLFTSCSKDDSSGSGEEMIEKQEVIITASDFSTTIDENPEASLLLGSITASINTNDALSYALTSESVSGALAIDSSTGELTVSDIATFDYETNTEVTAEVTISADDSSEVIDVTVSLNDIDDLESVLSTSKSKYTVASAGDWIEITEGEYNNLAESLNEVATAGLNDDLFEDDLDKLSGGASNYTICTYIATDASLKIKKDAYVFAFKYVNKWADGNRTSDQVKISSSITPLTATFTDLGDELSSSSGVGVKYFILKGNTLANTADGYLAFYSQNGIGNKAISGYVDYFRSGNSTTLSGTESSNIYHYQALTTTQKQW